MGPEQDATYELLAPGDDFRIGLAVEPATGAPPSATIELLVRLFRTGEELTSEGMDRASALVGRLSALGYSVWFQDDGWVSCERPAGGTDAAVEARLLRDIVGG